jgi:Na+-translocating ferredoxin:NAD+ oxidoreductase RNF subunit RnfB
VSPRTDGTIDPGRRDFLSGRFRGEGFAVIDHGTCLAWNGVICIGCRTACDEQAITIDARQRPTIVEAACTGCGICIDPCPSQAIGIEGRIRG